MIKGNIYIITTEDPLFTVKTIKEIDMNFPNQIKGVGLTYGLLTLERVILSPLIYGLINYFLLVIRIIYYKSEIY